MFGGALTLDMNVHVLPIGRVWPAGGSLGRSRVAHV
jgi:hypothetical protein